MKKVDYKKDPDHKAFYTPKQAPEILEIPAFKFLTLCGEGDPNGEAFGFAVEALYSLSYAVKMSYKSKDVPEGYYEYTVYPLEGVWDLVDTTLEHWDKSNFKYTIMIRQPEFLTPELFERFKAEVVKKKPNPNLEKVKLETVTEGLCCQMMHLGSYDDEPASFDRMEAFCKEKGYRRKYKTHREIYLSDPRKTEVDKRKTVLRFQVEAE